MKNETEKREAIAQLRKLLKPGMTVYPILRHCSSSGMSRVIDLVIPGPKRTIRSIGWLAAKAMGVKFDADRYGIKISGCGMDMGFQLVYSLCVTLWPNGTRKPHGTRNGEPDTAGGYALKHKWL